MTGRVFTERYMIVLAVVTLTFAAIFAALVLLGSEYMIGAALLAAFAGGGGIGRLMEYRQAQHGRGIQPGRGQT